MKNLMRQVMAFAQRYKWTYNDVIELEDDQRIYLFDELMKVIEHEKDEMDKAKR